MTDDQIKNMIRVNQRLIGELEAKIKQRTAKLSPEKLHSDSKLKEWNEELEFEQGNLTRHQGWLSGT
jgi:hypothetical protein